METPPPRKLPVQVVIAQSHELVFDVAAQGGRPEGGNVVWVPESVPLGPPSEPAGAGPTVQS